VFGDKILKPIFQEEILRTESYFVFLQTSQLAFNILGVDLIAREIELLYGNL